jgi:hypothetical protein
MHGKKKRNAYKVLIGVSETKRIFVTPRCRWKDNVKNGLKKLNGRMWTG